MRATKKLLMESREILDEIDKETARVRPMLTNLSYEDAIEAVLKETVSVDTCVALVIKRLNSLEARIESLEHLKTAPRSLEVELDYYGRVKEES